MVYLDLDNELNEVLPGLSLPAGAASFVFARIRWIQDGERDVFDMEAPPPWDFFDLCTLALLVTNREISSARLMLSNLQPCPPSSLLPSATLMTQNDNFLKKSPFSRRRKRMPRRAASSGHGNDARLQVMTPFSVLCSQVVHKTNFRHEYSSRQYI